eukprot:XP_001703573.1 predicted protein [Chlamydomonas reinhardtii]
MTQTSKGGYGRRQPCGRARGSWAWQLSPSVVCPHVPKLPGTGRTVTRTNDASFEESAYEFGGCEYRLCVSASPAVAAAAPGASVAAAGGCGGLTVRLEFSLPRLPAAFQRQVLGPEVRAALAAAFQGVARLLPDTAAAGGQEREGWSRSLASLRLLLAGHPIR